ncbi:jacalin-like lectin [Janthinobacterium sp. 17J80-10]|uniref:jacalin-like lectin n=1 Tax=Janthinobacterium sp. 17J80-10 TaxID=2497863 RepID=UPI0010056BC4|nr:jacalin-like lectin [Janthinobacterium sp. 17J80-10]QAU33103.1 lectin [Janthinobacterium sp. 17J80-10]
MKKAMFKAGFLLLGALAFPIAVQAQGVPDVSPSLKKMLGALPVDDAREELQNMVGALKKTSCGGNLTGCYATQSGPLQLYFFTSGQAQQTFLVVIEKKLAMPRLLGDKVQKVMGDTSLSSPIISISTTDFDLDTVKMPPELQKVVRENYFNVNALSFASGVQLAARANLGGPIKSTMEAFGVKGDQLTMRAAVVMPIPIDLAGGAGAGAGMASAVQHGDTMKKAGAEALKPEAYVEFQFAPNARLPLTTPPMNLTDATFFINNALTFGYKGNAAFKGVNDKKVLIQFQTPLDPAGALDLLDFQFRMATPSNFTLEDAAHVMVAMATPDKRLAQYGGGFIRNIESFKHALLDATKPLSVFQMKNPQPAPEYRFGDSSKPWPNDPRYFNIALLGPLAQNGPFMTISGDTVILGQKMGWLDASAGRSGLHGLAGEAITLKLGPLGRLKIRMQAMADIDKGTQTISLKGNVVGQAVNVILSGSSLTIDVPASCANPFEIKTTVALQASTNIADVFEGQGGANVDPTRIGGCVGKELEAALNKIAGEYKNLSGYTASAANAELKKISNAANAELKKAEDAARKAEEASRKEYEKTKNAARDVANKTSNAATNAFNAAGNAFKGIGKKKKHKKGPDPRFAASVFDWDYYYDRYPDLVKANVDLATHWLDHGISEGRRGSLEFDVRYYRNRYLDVQEMCGKKDYQCALQHWLDNGIEQGRQGSADFSVADYLDRYPDLESNLGKGNYTDALEHWLNDGVDAGRNGSPDSAFAGPVSGPQVAGGGGGGAWRDDATCGNQYVNGFRVRTGRSMDMVQFRYAKRGWAPAQGNQGGGTLVADVTLREGEYIVRVDYRSGDRVDQLSFTTNRGKTYGPYGGDGGSPGAYTVTPGEKLGCMAGRSGKATDQLIFSSTGPR